MSNFGDVFKMLTIRRLNFIDTLSGPKAVLKGPELACQRATVDMQLWPFELSSVALSLTRKAKTGKRLELYRLERPISHFIWRILSEVFS